MIRPVDLADNISKAPYADRVNQLQRRQPDTEQQTFHMQWLEKAAQEQNRPRKAEENERVRNDQQEGQSSAKEEQESEERREALREPEEEPPKDDILGNVVDMLA
jgi:hypothetical protein